MFATDQVLPLKTLLTEYKPAYGGDTWDQVINMFKEDTLQWQRVDALIQELKVHRIFDQPILLYSKQHPDFEPTDTQTILDGMHRLTAHIITQISPVYIHYGYPKSEGDYWLGNIELTFERVLTDEEFDDLLELGSFRVNDDCWGMLEGASAYNGQYTLNFVDVPCKYASAYKNKLLSRLPNAKLPSVKDVRVFYELFESE